MPKKKSVQKKKKVAGVKTAKPISKSKKKVVGGVKTTAGLQKVISKSSKKKGYKVKVKIDENPKQFAKAAYRALGIMDNEQNRSKMIEDSKGRKRPVPIRTKVTGQTRLDREEQAKWWQAVHSSEINEWAVKNGLPITLKRTEFGPNSKLGIPYCGLLQEIELKKPKKERDSVGRKVNDNFRCRKAKNQVEMFNLTTKGNSRLNSQNLPAFFTREEVNSMPKTLAVRMAQKYFKFPLRKNDVLDDWVKQHFGSWTKLRADVYKKVKDL